MDRNNALEKKFTRFRVLIIGRANAGKTTILQRVCKTTEVPQVHDKDGKEVDIRVQGSLERGEHDIENEITFRSNPRYVFHDSRGFEAGRIDELKKVKSFLEGRAKAPKLADRIHAIWYCIPMTDRARALTTAEDTFFSICGTSNVPVIAVFSKMDGLDAVAYQQLQKEGKNKLDAKSMAPERAMKIFDNGDYVQRLLAMKYPPLDHVCLREMDKENADCRGLIECTATALKDETLERLLVSTQQTNMGICITYAINRTLRRYLGSNIQELQSLRSEHGWEMQKDLAAWFPHVLVRRQDDLRQRLRLRQDVVDVQVRRVQDQYVRLDDVLDLDVLLDDYFADFECFHNAHVQSSLESLLHGPSINKVVILASSILLILEHSFYFWYNKQPGNPLLSALEQYIGSPLPAIVDAAVGMAIKANQDHKFLCNAIIDIVLQNCLTHS